jgi:hypothetical protein
MYAKVIDATKQQELQSYVYWERQNKSSNTFIL